MDSLSSLLVDGSDFCSSSFAFRFFYLLVLRFSLALSSSLVTLPSLLSWNSRGLYIIIFLVDVPTDDVRGT